MRVTVVHLVVALLAECDQVPCFVLVFLVVFRWEDVVDVLSFPELPVSFALLAHISITLQDVSPDCFPTF